MLEGCFLAVLGAFGMFTVIWLYPLALFLSSRRTSAVPPPEPHLLPTVTIITAARNAAALLPAKLQNFSELDYPPERLFLFIASDASTDATAEIVVAERSPRIRLVEQQEHQASH